MKSILHFLWRAQNTGTASKAQIFELLSVIYKSGPLNWTQASFRSYTNKKHSRGKQEAESQLQAGQNWEKGLFSQGDVHVRSLPRRMSFPEYFFFSKPGCIQETGFLILVLVNIFMHNSWENSEESKSVINKREQGMLKISHDSRYHKGAGDSWNIFKCCLFIYVCIDLQA